MNYRIAGQNDIKAINTILTLSFDKLYAHFAKKSFSSLKNVFVVEDGPNVAGIINYRIFDLENKKIGYLYWLAVHPLHRRKGIGKGLVLEANNHIIKEIGPSDIYAAVANKNLPSLELFKGMGFAPVSRSAFKRKYGARGIEIYSSMNVMPWEGLLELPAK